MKELLALRKSKKSIKPTFLRQKFNQKKKLASSWRRPKGLHSKLRLGKKGHSKKVSSGYRSPQAVKHMTQDGKNIIMIRSVQDLNAIKEEAIIISSNFGMKKRIEIIKKAIEKNITILNIKDPQAFIKNNDELRAKKKEEKAKKTKEKEEKKKDLEKKSKDKDKEKDSLAEKVEDEERAALQKKEKDKLLTKKGM
tara:strand:+ start:11595 stop:12179 length:585 start_codon:yes stop_codon:yes gene_type:complete